MSDSRDIINQLIIFADKDIQDHLIEEGMKKFEEAKRMALRIQWEERALQIDAMIADIKQKAVVEEQKREKLQLEQEKQRQLEEEAQKQDQLRQQEISKQDLERQKRIEAQKLKKDWEEMVSNEAYNFLEKGSKAIQKNEFDEGIYLFENALEKFKLLGWSAETYRVSELLGDARTSLEKYIKRCQDEAVKAEQLQASLKEQDNQIKVSQEQKLVQVHELAKKEKLIEKQEQMSQQIADEVFHQIDLAETEVKNYLNMIKLVNILDSECPYSHTIAIYLEGSQKLESIGRREEAARLHDGMLVYQEKLAKDEKLRLLEQKKREKKRIDEEYLQKQIQQSELLKKQKTFELEDQKRKEQQVEAQKQAIAQEIFREIEEMEKKAKEYERHVDFWKYECPYQLISQSYEKNSVNFRQIGWIEQADRLMDGALAYQDRMKRDIDLRMLEIKKRQKSEEELKDLQRLTQDSKIRQEALEREQKEKQQKLFEEQKYKESIAQTVFQRIDAIEIEIKHYENFLDRIPYKAPYTQAIQIYREGFQTLQNIGWKEAADRIHSGIQLYEQKLAQDMQYREKEKLRSAKTQEEAAILEERTRMSLEMEKKRKLEEQEKVHHEMQQHQFLESIAANVYKFIDDIENEVKKYESLSDPFKVVPPYERAIQIYQHGANTLKDIGFMDQSIKLYDGSVAYRKKMEIDQELREKHKQMLLKTQQDAAALREQEQLTDELKKQKANEEKQRHQAENEEKQRKQAVFNSVYKIIDEFEVKVKLYENHPNRFSLPSPYTEGIIIYQQSRDTLKQAGLIEESIRINEGMLAYRERDKHDKESREIVKLEEKRKREEEMHLQQQIQASQSMKAKIEEEEKLKKEQELRDKLVKQSIAEQIFKEIDVVEQEVKMYESRIEKVPFLPPYEKAISVYEKCSQEFAAIQWTDQSTKLLEGIKSYRIKLAEDHRYREQEKLRVAKTKEEEKMLEERARLSREQTRQREQEEKDRRERETRDKIMKQSIANQIFAEIETIEQEVKTYEIRIDKIPYNCPYEKSINVYEKCIKEFAAIQWTEQATKLLEGIKTYRQKLAEDHRYREQEKLRIAKTKEEEKMLEERARLSQEQTRQREQEEKERRDRETRDKLMKQSIANEIFAEIESIEHEIRAYESRLDKFPYESPYEKAIIVYGHCIKSFSDIQWTEQATKLLEGIKTYQQKLAEDHRYRENEKLRVAKTKEEEKMLEERIRLSREQTQQREQEEKDKRERETRDKLVKQSIADQIFRELETIEQEVKVYESRIDKIPYMYPYEKTITIYEKCIKDFAAIQWTEQATKLLEGIKTYRQKLAEDHRYRENEKLRVAKTKEEEKMLEERIRLSREQVQQHEQEEKDKREREIRDRLVKQSIADQIFRELETIGQEVKVYESRIDKIPYICPYEKAINVYEKSTKELASIQLTEQATKLLEGIKSYRQKLAEDHRYRENEKLRVAKTKEEERMLEERIRLSKEQARQRDQEEKIRREKEIQEKAKKQAILDKVLKDIANTEQETKHYDSLIDKSTVSPPFERIISIYEYSIKTLADNGYTVDATKLLEGLTLYRNKLNEYNQSREAERRRVEFLRSVLDEFEEK